ncbi:MAG: DUF362 domain-containing protein [Deltaproteobacteria bacterium]|nr:DUF362 domain-containing protein [Desulfitobacteriaceae bacterium]MDI6855082.1 DUF362 domain-containing protein [Deltaproteobacteria bacterium]
MEFTRRQFIATCLGGMALGLSGFAVWQHLRKLAWKENTFIAKAPGYQADLAGILTAGLKELGVTPAEIKGKTVLLKPNLVETSLGAPHINTHPLVVRGAAEAFFKLGAGKVLVAEGPGHIRDTLLVLEESGLAEVLREDRLPFIDFNYETGFQMANAARYSPLKTLTFPMILKEVDILVSLAKLKTHHWAGVTLSMKNLFGLMPGSYYGWPKNVLHVAGIDNCILDINATIKPHLAIVDGIVGMEGDGPIMGTPKEVGVLVLGRNLTATDATCARIMGVDPHRVRYLARADGRLGPVREGSIAQRGETIASVRTNFQLLEHIPAHRGLRRL